MDFEKITKYLDSLAEYDIPSVDCMICEDHRVLYRHMCGTVDEKRQKAISGNEQYLMFSMTKIQTMVCIMKLVEEGKLSLEDPVGKYLPAFSELKVEREGRVEPAGITLRLKHLVSMQSGLDYDLSRGGIPHILEEKGAKATTRELVDAFAESPLKFEPGEHFLYSLSHDVVAAVVEVVSGLRFGEFMRQTIWEPLGMKNTWFAKPMNEDNPRLAAQFTRNGEGKSERMPKSCNYQLSEAYESGGAGLISSTEDYAVLGDAIACGGMSKSGVPILKPETIEIMKTNLLGEASRRDIATTMGRKGYGYGCGVQILMEPELIGSTAPAGVFGWDGAAGSAIMMDTASKRSVVYIQHVRNCGVAYDRIHPTLRDLVFESGAK